MRELSVKIDSSIPDAQARAILDHLREIILVADDQGRIRFLNAAWTRLSGYSVEETVGRALADFLIPEDRETSLRNLARLMKGEGGDVRFTRRIFVKSGGIMHLDVSIQHASPDEGITCTMVDVSEHVRERERRLEGELNIQSFFKTAAFPIGLVEIRGDDVTHALRNPAADHLMSIIAEDPALFALWMSKYRETRRAERAITFDYVQPSAEGPLSLRCTVNFVALAPDGAERYSYVILDRTAETIQDRALEHERQQLLFLTSNLDDVIWMTDPAHRQLLYISPAFERVWERSLASLRADPNTFADAIHPEDRDRVVAALANHERETFDQTYRLVMPDGRIKWIRDHASVVRDPGGAPLKIVGIASDVTEARRKDIVIREQNERLAMILNTIPVGIASFDAGGASEWGNAQWAVLTDGVAMPDVAEDSLWRDLMVTDADGRTSVLSITTVKLTNDKSLRIAKDATARYEQDRVIEAQRAQMAQSARLSALGEMAAGVAHEINNPLAIISGTSQYLQLLATGGEPTLPAPAVAQACDRIVATVNRIAKIINGLRALSRDGSEDAAEDINLNGVIEDALELCQARIRSHQIDLRAATPTGVIWARCRSVQIAQVLVNLLNNAFDAVLAQERREIQISLTEAAGEIHLEVTDSGPGIPAAIQDKIMNPFFTTKPVGKGTGLGLSLSRAIVEANGGRLSFETGPIGTTFRISLPATPRP